MCVIFSAFSKNSMYDVNYILLLLFFHFSITVHLRSLVSVSGAQLGAWTCHGGRPWRSGADPASHGHCGFVDCVPGAALLGPTAITSPRPSPPLAVCVFQSLFPQPPPPAPLQSAALCLRCVSVDWFLFARLCGFLGSTCPGHHMVLVLLCPTDCSLHAAWARACRHRRSGSVPRHGPAVFPCVVCARTDRPWGRAHVVAIAERAVNSGGAGGGGACVLLNSCFRFLGLCAQ